MGTENKHSYRDKLIPLYTELPAIHEEKGTNVGFWLSQHTTNAGLWLDKYIKNQDQEDTDNRGTLVKEVAAISVPLAYKQFYRRWEYMLASVDVKTRIARAKGRMIVGLGDESVLETSIALHHTYGVPYIPGSALKGLAASYARQRLGEPWRKGDWAYNVIFGDTDNAGFITFFDALLHIDPDSDPDQPGASVLRRDTITVHHPDYYQGKKDATPSDWDSPTPIPFLSATGKYLIALAAPDLEDASPWITRTFKILRYALEEMGIGAKTSSGYGRMTLETRKEDEAPEDPEMTGVVAEVIPETAAERLLREIKEAPQATYELFAAWEQLPPTPCR